MSEVVTCSVCGHPLAPGAPCPRAGMNGEHPEDPVAGVVDRALARKAESDARVAELEAALRGVLRYESGRDFAKYDEQQAWMEARRVVAWVEPVKVRRSR